MIYTNQRIEGFVSMRYVYLRQHYFCVLNHISVNICMYFIVVCRYI